MRNSRSSNSKPEWIEEAKRRAALKAIEHVRDGYVVGLGSGSTAAYAIRELGRRLRTGELTDILGVPTSHQAAMTAVEAGVPLTTLYEHPEVDVAIDGADQIDPELNLIKGLGAALTREKVVAESARLFIVVADERKLVEVLGGRCPVPLEVLPFALPRVLKKLRKIAIRADVRWGSGKVGPVVTDNGNFIVDAYFNGIDNPEELHTKLKTITGVVETGIFPGIAKIAYIGTEKTVKRMERKA